MKGSLDKYIVNLEKEERLDDFLLKVIFVPTSFIGLVRYLDKRGNFDAAKIRENEGLEYIQVLLDLKKYSFYSVATVHEAMRLLAYGGILSKATDVFF